MTGFVFYRNAIGFICWLLRAYFLRYKPPNAIPLNTANKRRFCRFIQNATLKTERSVFVIIIIVTFLVI